MEDMNSPKGNKVLNENTDVRLEQKVKRMTYGLVQSTAWYQFICLCLLCGFIFHFFYLNSLALMFASMYLFAYVIQFLGSIFILSLVFLQITAFKIKRMKKISLVSAFISVIFYIAFTYFIFWTWDSIENLTVKVLLTFMVIGGMVLSIILIKKIKQYNVTLTKKVDEEKV